MPHGDSLPSNYMVTDLLTRILSANSREESGRILREAIEADCRKLSLETIREHSGEFSEWESRGITAYLSSVIGRLEALNTPTEEFYGKLAEHLFFGHLFPDYADQRAVLTLALCYPSLPYRHLDDYVSMDDATYGLYRERLRAKEGDIAAISHRSFPQKTQFASACLDIIDSVDDARERAVLFTVMLDLCGNQQ